ncbi:MAG TPA: polysaccharide biosynthesis tyrosine autokinase, partial [Acidobacteriota bacterium]|nr:polysaccharide biosynthesis tyrosine autokinase [Acidobacteriota bacterium]
ILKSRRLLSRVVRRLDLAREPEKIQEYARWFSYQLETEPIRGTQIVQISFLSPDPNFAAQFTNAIAEEYIVYTFDTKFEATTRATDFLSQELVELKKRVEKSDEALVQYAREHNLVNAEERNNIVVQRLSDLNQQITKVEAELYASQYEAIKDATAETLPVSLQTPLMAQLRQRISTIEQDLASLTTQFGPRWPDVIRLQEQKAMTEQQLKVEVAKAIENERVKYEALVAQRNKLAQALAAQNALVNRLEQDSIQYNILKREVEANQQLYEGLLQRMKEAGVLAGLRSSNIQIVDPAEVPTAPYLPRVKLNLLLGLIAGLGLGVMAAFAAEFMDKTLKTPRQVEEALGLPSLAVIPVLDTDSKRHLLQARTGETEETSIVSYLRSLSPLAWESYRALRTALLLSTAGRPPQKIMVTSALPEEGKTTTALHLAISLAQTGARTVLVELDLRRPVLSKIFSVSRSKGMSRYLSSDVELASQVEKTGVPNLFLIPGGPVPPNPPELMGSDRMKASLDVLSEFFTYVVIDSPPILSVTDGLVIAPSMDGIVLVINGSKTPKNAVIQARGHLDMVGGRVLGALINRVNFNGGGYGYAYPYYHAYGVSDIGSNIGKG